MTVRHDPDDVAGDLDVTWAEGDDADELFDNEPSSSYPPESLVTFRFLADAMRRHARVWIATALVGLIVGVTVPIVMPAASESSVKLLLVHQEGDDPVQAMATDVSLVSTNTVAQRAIDELGLTESTDEILDRYQATPLTDRVMEITASAPSSTEATQLAAELGDIYLAFREDQARQQVEPLRDKLDQASGKASKAREELLAVGGDPDDPAAQPSKEARRYTRAIEEQQFIEQQILDQQVVATRLSASRILDTAAPVERSERLAMVVSAGTGIVAGGLLGLGFVVVRALLSERLWRRQDIAMALGVPVRLGVGQPSAWRWRRFSRNFRRSQMENQDVQLAVQQLRASVLWHDSPKPALTVVGVNNVDHTALIVASLATSFVSEGWRVLVVDLSGTHALGAFLGRKEAGTYEPQPGGDAFEQFALYLPLDDSYGGFNAGRVNEHQSPVPDEALDAAWADADIVLTLAMLSPALGAEHLRAWSSRAAVVVTAGKSTATELQSVSEMIRLARLRFDSALVVRSDRTDVSVGVTATSTASSPSRG